VNPSKILNFSLNEWKKRSEQKPEQDAELERNFWQAIAGARLGAGANIFDNLEPEPRQIDPDTQSLLWDLIIKRF
jgi:hypothetical protein